MGQIGFKRSDDIQVEYISLTLLYVQKKYCMCPKNKLKVIYNTLDEMGFSHHDLITTISQKND